ncbi:MAG: hypothetical protein Kow00107_02800 [Planctomycetota bacterium]
MPANINGIAFVSVYAENYQDAFKFYSEVLGLQKSFDMGDAACFFELGNDQGLYLQGGNRRQSLDMETMRCAFTFTVPSMNDLVGALEENDVDIVHPPQEMGENIFWVVFKDPDGNLLEAIGPK